MMTLTATDALWILLFLVPVPITLCALSFIAGYQRGAKAGDRLSMAAKECMDSNRAVVNANIDLVGRVMQSHDNLTYGAALLMKAKATGLPDIGATAMPSQPQPSMSADEVAKVRDEMSKLERVLSGESDEGLEDLARFTVGDEAEA